MSSNTSDSVNDVADEQHQDHQTLALSSEERLRKLEMELAQTKLALVESQCRNQELEKKLERAGSSRSNRSSFLGRGKKKT